MKVITPEIAWHEREPVYSVDFQTNSGDKKEICRLASGGVDKIVRVSNLTSNSLTRWRHNLLNLVKLI